MQGMDPGKALGGDSFGKVLEDAHARPASGGQEAWTGITVTGMRALWRTAVTILPAKSW